MKILIITSHFLDANGGGSFASRAFINAFSEIAESSLLLYPDRGNPIDNFIHKKCILIGISDKRSDLEKAMDIFRGRIHIYTEVALKKINEYMPDIVVFDNSICSAGVIKQIKGKVKKIITIHHNYMMEYYKGTKPYAGWKSIFLNYPFLFQMKRTERDAILSSDLNFALTDEDVNSFYKYYDPQKFAKIVKLGCFESTTDSISNLKTDNNKHINIKRLCFAITGSLNSYQSEVSIIPFLKNLYPLLIKRLPESRLIIAGKNPSEKMRLICSQYPSITLIANPKNMQNVIAQANIYIAPTCVGGGIKLRVMDGLKAGLPVLAHKISSRGYDEFKNSNYLFIYEDKITFEDNLDKLLELIQNSHLNMKAIQATYNSIFSFKSGVSRLIDILTHFEMN